MKIIFSFFCIWSYNSWGKVYRNFHTISFESIDTTCSKILLSTYPEVYPAIFIFVSDPLAASNHFYTDWAFIVLLSSVEGTVSNRTRDRSMLAVYHVLFAISQLFFSFMTILLNLVFIIDTELVFCFLHLSSILLFVRLNPVMLWLFARVVLITAFTCVLSLLFIEFA